MYEQKDSRMYQRGSHFYNVAKISLDEKKWTEVEISDISSGGLQMRTDIKFDIGTMLWFDLVIQGFFTQFQLKVKGLICRAQVVDKHNVYGVAFKGLSQELKVRIDESVKNDRPLEGHAYQSD